MAQDLQDRVVTPTLAAGALFDQFPYLTRLYTTLSPEDMNKDPVFSFNPGLKDWPNVHDGTLTYHCGFFGDRGQSPTPRRRCAPSRAGSIDYPNGTGVRAAAVSFTPPSGPSSQRIEILREQGSPAGHHRQHVEHLARARQRRLRRRARRTRVAPVRRAAPVCWSSRR